VPSQFPIPRFLLVIFLTFALVARFSLAADGQSPKKLSPEDRTEVNALLQKYRSAGSDFKKKQEICDKVLAFGPAAAPLINAVVERDLQAEYNKYSGKFQSQAVAVARQKTAKVDMMKVVALRVAAHELQKLGEGFTKEVIVEKIDPLVVKLKQVFIVEPSEVLNKSPDLQAQRKKLETFGEMRDRCRALMPLPPVKHVAKKGGAKNSGKANAEKSSPDKPVAEKDSEKSPPSFATALQSDEEIAASMATPQDARTRSVMAMNAKIAENLDPEEARAILELNLTRTLLGLPALVIDLRLCEAAREHSQDMDRLKFFSHESPVPGKRSFVDRAKLVGATANAENIFAGTSSGKSANEGWFHSPGHHRNQMGNAMRVGVGRSGTYFTQMFGS
jgi:uncharacterized protein YkwD